MPNPLAVSAETGNTDPCFRWEAQKKGVNRFRRLVVQ